MTTPPASSPSTTPSGSPRLVRVAEHEAIPLRQGELLDPHTGELLLFPHVLNRNYLRVLSRGREVTLQAGPYVGVLALNPYVTLEIVPRVPVAGLVRVLATAGGLPQRLPAVLRTYATQAVPLAELRDELTEALTRQVQLIGATGLHYTYDARPQETSFPRGRLLLHPTVTRLLARGRRHLAVSSWFTRQFDTLPNQLLQLALRTLVAAYRSQPPSKAGRRHLDALREALTVFSGVSPLTVRPSALPALLGRLSRLPPTYEPALELVQLVLGARGLDFGRPAGLVQLPTLLWKMDELFEGYLRTSLRQGLAAQTARWAVLDGNHLPAGGGGARLLFDHGPDQRLASPDLVVADASQVGVDRPVAVWDVKYKPKPPEREDLNQVLAYALSYRVQVAGILTLAPAGQASQLNWLGEVNAVQVYHYCFQLGSPDLPAEEALLVQALLSLLPT